MGILYNFLPFFAAGAGYVHAVGRANVFEPELNLKTALWVIAGYVGGLVAQEVIAQQLPSFTAYSNTFARGQ